MPCLVTTHLKKKKLEELRNSIFVDNIFLLNNQPEELIRLFNIIRNHFLDASMNIREWMSNDPMVLNAIPENVRQSSMESKMLGLQWDAEKDTLSIEFKNEKPKSKWTKRNVLKFIASTFDPLGFLLPVTIKARIFMQQLFKENLEWDDPLSDKLVEEWKEIIKEWNGSIVFPRQLFPTIFPDSEKIEILGFADASPHAYCAALYLRIPNGDEYCTRLLMVKIRLKPIEKNKKKLTIPKMEVMGIWLAAKLIIYVVKELKLDRSSKTILTDSLISYYWFQKWPKEVFVANRLKEVLEAGAECLFVPGKLNPADLGTRGISLEELRNSDCWWNGPEFLKKSREHWPKISETSVDRTVPKPILGDDFTQTIMALVRTRNIHKVDGYYTTETCKRCRWYLSHSLPI
uniref:Uncharacterized protein n=1 Tax=Panagrolaimus davidi TaxID=227884 RepID=A0A914PX54_9BILA